MTLNPLIGVIIAWAAQLIVLIILLLDAPKWNPEAKTPKWWIHQTAISFFTILYLIIAFLLIDIAVFWLAGSWSLADWRWQIPNVSIILITGSLYFYFVIWNSKSRVMNFFLFIFISITLGFVIHIYASQSDLMADALSQGFGIAFPIIALGGSLGHLWLNTHNPVSEGSQKQKKLKFKSILIGSFILWIILFIQVSILYDGNSFLYIF